MVLHAVSTDLKVKSKHYYRQVAPFQVAPTLPPKRLPSAPAVYRLTISVTRVSAGIIVTPSRDLNGIIFDARWCRGRRGRGIRWAR